MALLFPLPLCSRNDCNHSWLFEGTLAWLERGPSERESQKGTDCLTSPLCESVREQVSTCALGFLAGENRWSQLFRLVHECAGVISQQQLSGGIPPTIEYHFLSCVPHCHRGLQVSSPCRSCSGEQGPCAGVLAAAVTDAHVLQASSSDSQPPTGLCASSAQFAS